MSSQFLLFNLNDIKEKVLNQLNDLLEVLPQIAGGLLILLLGVDRISHYFTYCASALEENTC